MIIAQITDLHVRPVGRPAYRVAETNMLAERALRHLGTIRPAPDAVIITGDLTDCGQPAEYAHLDAMLARRGGRPPYVIPGNHDRRETMRAHLPFLRAYAGETGFVQYAVDELPVRLVMLDTVVPGAGHGELCDARLAWLERALAARPEAPTLIGMHHPPFACGVAHMDRIALRDPERFAAIVARHRQVRLIACGHAHRGVFGMVAHCPAMICPSVAHQVELDLAAEAPAAFVLEPPGFALHLWQGAHFASHAALVERYPGPFPFVLDPEYPGHA